MKLRTILALAVGLLGALVLTMGVIGVVYLLRAHPFHGSLAWSIGGDAALLVIGGGALWTAWTNLSDPPIRRRSNG
jgi:arginine exporter protein ArgO